ncbi:MAG TPA: PACE efflux transporter [Burkholderiaceae bacterium]
MSATGVGLRTPRERVIQTLWFEGPGLALVAPLYAAVTGAGVGDSFAMVGAVSVVVMAWAMLFNTLFDHIERRLAGRAASQRPHRLRWLHAVLLEGSAVVVSCPVIVALTPLTWGQALLADLGLTLAYAAYAYAFHLVFDRLRPVASA